MAVEKSNWQKAILKYSFLKKERHHDHEIIIDKMDGKFYWKEDPAIRKIIDEIGLEKIYAFFELLGVTKNSEIIRKMYRGMGYSLFGYWELFYCETNNPKAKDYKPNQQ